MRCYLRAREAASVPQAHQSDGSVLPAKPRSEEREGGAGEAIIGGSRKPHFDTMGSLFLWVSYSLGAAKGD